MTKIDKLITRFLNKPSNFTWDELVKLLSHYGFNEIKTGKTSGSRRKFQNNKGTPVYLHKPHPQNIVKKYVLNQIIEILKTENLL